MKPLVILTGPTAVGKTKLSIALAKAINGEIISADSMQVYKKMNIGTAKITTEEMQGVPHYLVDEFEPDEEFNVVKFQTCAKRYMEEIYAKGKIPILVGGTGFYIQAIVKDIDFTQNDNDTTYRMQLEEEAKQFGAEVLHEKLRTVDRKAADAIHVNNVKKVIRALEFYHQTGECISDHNEIESQKISPYDFRYFVLTDERDNLYKNIDLRVDLMIQEGLVNEVEQLRNQGYDRSLVSMQGLGYKEILDYLDGNITLDEAVYIIKRDTRHFAKRQMTWFRREKDVIFVDKNAMGYDNEKLLSFIIEKLK